MSLMSRAGILGGIAGGAERYNELRDEDRREDREIKKEVREEDIFNRRETRLEEFQLLMAGTKRDHENNLVDKETKARIKALETATGNRQTTTKPGDVVVDNNGNPIYTNENERSGKGATTASAIVVQTRKGGQSTREQLRKDYAENHTVTGVDGFKRTKEGSPSFTNWYNSQVVDRDQLSDDLILDADLNSPPSAGEMALAEARLNEDNGMFDFDANEDEIVAEVFRLREEKVSKKRAERSSGLMTGPGVGSEQQTTNTKAPDPLGLFQ